MKRWEEASSSGESDAKKEARERVGPGRLGMKHALESVGFYLRGKNSFEADIKI